jgi:cell division protein FtsW
MKPKQIDTLLLSIVIILVVGGFLIFTSASLGLLARTSATFGSVATSQLLFGLLGGGISLFLLSNLHYRHLRKYAFYIFIASLLLTAAVFIPGVGDSRGGATRWIEIGRFSLQPAEILKLGFIIYVATWLSGMTDVVHTFLKGTLPFYGILALVGIVTLAQPDTGTFMLMATAGTAMFIVAGGSWRDVILTAIIGVLLLAALAFSRPYVMDRITSFMNIDDDPRGSGYQIQQSLIATGAGGFLGRGFGQSIQKFEYLPEPISDSIFAVYAEEFGFLGTFILVMLYIGFAFRGFKIAANAQDLFGTLLVVGFVSLIASQAFLNIAAIIGIAPLSGLPLPFISHGGTAMLSMLTMVGIVLNVSKFRKRTAIS